MLKFLIWFIIIFAIAGYVALFYSMFHPDCAWIRPIIGTGYGFCFGGTVATWIKMLMGD